MIFSNEKVYTILKWVDLTFIPALIVFLGVILPLFDCKCTEVVLSVLGACDVFLGTLIGVSSNRYAKANSEVEEVVEDDSADK